MLGVVGVLGRSVRPVDASLGEAEQCSEDRHRGGHEQELVPSALVGDDGRHGAHGGERGHGAESYGDR